MLLLSAFCGLGTAFAQQAPIPKKDTVSLTAPFNIQESNNMRLREGIFDNDPPNLVRTIEYDPATNMYILYERVGDMLYRPAAIPYLQ